MYCGLQCRQLCQSPLLNILSSPSTLGLTKIKFAWPNISRDFIPVRPCLLYWIPVFFMWNKNIPAIFFLWNNIPLNYVSGEKGEFGLSTVITALRNEYYPGSSKGGENRCRRYVHSSVATAFSRVRMGLETGRHWMNTQNVHTFANCVRGTPQCYICKYVITNSSKDSLCVICFPWTSAPMWGC